MGEGEGELAYFLYFVDKDLCLSMVHGCGRDEANYGVKCNNWLYWVMARMGELRLILIRNQ